MSKGATDEKAGSAGAIVVVVNQDARLRGVLAEWLREADALSPKCPSSPPFPSDSLTR